MSVGTLIRSSYLLYFSQPAADRSLLKAIKGRPIRTIVELGVGLGGRTERVLEVAGWRAECLPLRYTGIDLFESRPAGQPKLALKQAFHDLRATGATIRLIPGDPASALAQAANFLIGTDLLLIAADCDAPSLARAWRFVPRMIHARTLVFQHDAAGGSGNQTWRQLAPAEVEKLAAAAGKASRLAA